MSTTSKEDESKGQDKDSSQKTPKQHDVVISNSGHTPTNLSSGDVETQKLQYWCFLVHQLLLSLVQSSQIHLKLHPKSLDLESRRILLLYLRRTERRNSKLVKNLRKKYGPSQDWKFRFVHSEELAKICSSLERQMAKLPETHPEAYFKAKAKYLDVKDGGDSPFAR